MERVDKSGDNELLSRDYVSSKPYGAPLEHSSTQPPAKTQPHHGPSLHGIINPVALAHPLAAEAGPSKKTSQKVLERRKLKVAVASYTEKFDNAFPDLKPKVADATTTKWLIEQRYRGTSCPPR